MKKLILILAAAGLMTAGFAIPAMAKGHGGKGGKHTAGTGKEHPRGFKAFDGNSDGSVSFDEFKTHHEALAAARAAKSGKSGKHHKGKGGKKHLTLQERFDRRDQNHDGSITKAEWKATKQHHHHKGGGKKGGASTGTTAKAGKHHKK